MTFRKILTFLIAVTLLAGPPAIASSGTDNPGCETTYDASAYDCCSGHETGVSDCSIACLAAPAAADSRSAAGLAPDTGAASLSEVQTLERSLAWPPDTAPPKRLSA